MRKVTNPETAKTLIKNELYARHSKIVCRVNDKISGLTLDMDFVDQQPTVHNLEFLRETIYEAYNVYGEGLAELSTEKVILNMMMVKFDIHQDTLKAIQPELNKTIKKQFAELKARLADLVSTISKARNVLDTIS